MTWCENHGHVDEFIWTYAGDTRQRHIRCLYCHLLMWSAPVEVTA